MSLLTARTVFITGASKGLGLEFVKQMLVLPFPPETIFASCLDPSDAGDLRTIASTSSSVKMIKLDVNEDKGIQAAYEETRQLLGNRGLNLLINNAGINDRSVDGTFMTVTRERMQKHFNCNSTAPLLVTQKFLPLLQMTADKNDPHLSNSKSGVIVLSSAMGSKKIALDGKSVGDIHYRCSKAALTMATVMMANELREQGILVMALHPGQVMTDMGAREARLTPEESIAACLNVIAKAGNDYQGKIYNLEGNIVPF